VTSLPNFSTIGQCMAESLTIRQIFPVHFTRVLILKLLNDSHSSVAERYQTVGEHSPIISFLKSTSVRYVAPFRNKSDSNAMRSNFGRFARRVKIRGGMGEMLLMGYVVERGHLLCCLTSVRHTRESHLNDSVYRNMLYITPEKRRL